MLTRIAIGLAAGSLLLLGTLAPALADIPNCMKYPNAATCPTMGQPTPQKVEQGTPKHLRHSHYRSPQAPSKG
jgi:hypothetical protein